MATKVDRMVTFVQGLLFLELLDPLVRWSCNITWQTKKSISLLPQCLQPLNLERFLPIKSHEPLISNTTLSMATILDGMVTYPDELLSSKSYGSKSRGLTESCGLISLLPQWLLRPNLAG